MDAQASGLARQIVLTGFMAAGKTTVGREVARLAERRFVDLDDEIERLHGSIPTLFERGEQHFRQVEAQVLEQALAIQEPLVLALGAGAVSSPHSRALLARADTLVLQLDVDVELAWQRVRTQGIDRPLARDEPAFRKLFAERAELYRAVSAATVRDAWDVLLALADVVLEAGALSRLEQLLPGEGPYALVADGRVLELHGPAASARCLSRHTLPSGEAAKTFAQVERLCEELRLDRDGTLVVLGGGAATDVGGFAASCYLRGVSWVAVPTTLVGQIDAAIGGKTGVNLQAGKNLAGAFHLPELTVIDPDVLATLPPEEWRNGLAEAVKAGLLMGEEVWHESPAELVRRCAAFKVAVCAADLTERGRRQILNLGHTFAHALEAGADYQLAHGAAVALGLLAALRLSEDRYGLDSRWRAQVQQALAPEPVRADLQRAWQALGRDKKVRAGRTRLVLLEDAGRPVFGVELEERAVRQALEALII